MELWLFIACGVLLLVVLLALVVRPLWRDSQRLAISLLIAFPLSLAGLYVLVGTPDALDPVKRTEAPSLDSMVLELEQELQRNPDNLDGWLLLAGVRKQFEDYALAADALRRAISLDPENPNVLTELAELLSLSHAERQFSPEAVELLDRALSIDSNHQRALWFRGIAAMQAEQFAQAAQLWERLLPLTEGTTGNQLLTQINRAREQAGMQALVLPGVELRITLNAQLGDVSQSHQTLYVIARSADGAGFPVAVQKIDQPTFPLTLRLSDLDSPMPAQKLSAQNQVEIIARLSQSGDAAAVSGDIESAKVAQALPSEGVLTLNMERVIE